LATIATDMHGATLGREVLRQEAAAMGIAAGEGALRFRALFISDIHLGTPACPAERLLDLLRLTESEHLYLVGNILDGRQLRERFYWHQSHNDVIQKLLRKARKGARVTYVAGSHDEAMRHFLGLAFGGIEIVDEAVHRTADGRRLLVIHGDRFRSCATPAWWNPLRRWGAGAARKPDGAAIAAFEEALAREALRRRFDGVVCGHIRQPRIREIGGVLYCNDGDWVESQTALAEREDGELRILDWKAVEDAAGSAATAMLHAGLHAHPDRD